MAAWGRVWCSGLSGGGGAEKGSGVEDGGAIEMMSYEVVAAEEGAIPVAKEQAEHLGQNLSIEAK